MQTSSPPSSSSRGPQDLRDSKPFTDLAKRARRREELDRRLCQTLPAPLRDHVHLADLRRGRLVFLVPSPAWATRLRLAQAQLIATARALGIQANSVGVKVIPPPAAPAPEPPPRATLSPAAARHLKTAARSLSDTELQRLFLALASTAEPLDSPRKTD